MTSTDDILAQIDHAVDDWTISEDAMRSKPVVEPQSVARTAVWIAPVGTDPRDTGAWQEVGYITDLDMTIDPATIDPAAGASAPVATWDEIQQYIAHIEAQRARRAAALQAFIGAYVEAVKPAVEAAGAAFAEMSRTLQQVGPDNLRHLPEAEGCNQCTPPPRRDRPAWQSPYGPARRRR